MSIGQSITKRVTYKAYASSLVTPGSPPAQGTDPAATGGQTLRYQTCTFGLERSAYESEEKRTSRMKFDRRLGGHTSPGEITGELSPLTYQDLMAAVVRGSWAAAVSKSQADFTSVTISGGVATVGTSSWVAQGFRIGDVVRFGSLSVSANNSKNFTLIALGTFNTAATFFPAPTDNTIDSNFTVATVGRKVFAPFSSHVTPLFAVEQYDSLLDLADLTKQIRFGQMRLNMPTEGIVKCAFSGLGRTTERLVSGSSPFFTSPTAATTSSLLTSNGGNLVMAGTSQSLITSLDLTVDCGVSAQSAAFTLYPPDIYTGQLSATGSIAGMWQDNTIPNYFDNETEVEISFILTDSIADNAEFISCFMPRVKLFNFKKGDNRNAGIPWTANFEALEKAATTGYDSSCISFQDSLSA